MIGFVVAHLVGNLLIYAGPEAFNAYAHKLASLGPIVWVMRFGLIGAIVLHVWLTITLVKENRKARPQAYDIDRVKGDRSYATRAMKYTGIFIILFIMLHLYDFTFGNKSGPQSVITGLNNDESLELFGLVWNSFSFSQGWWRVPIYLIAVTAVGMHLSHAIQSVFQTFGFNHDRYTPVIRMVSIAVGVIVALAFALIPIYVFIMPEPFGV